MQQAIKRLHPSSSPKCSFISFFKSPHRRRVWRGEWRRSLFKRHVLLHVSSSHVSLQPLLCPLLTPPKKSFQEESVSFKPNEETKAEKTQSCSALSVSLTPLCHITLRPIIVMPLIQINGTRILISSLSGLKSKAAVPQMAT